MNLFFRVDASIQIGSGHVMRCLTLAEVMRKKGAAVRFICRELSGNLCDFIESKNYPVSRLPDSGGSDCGTLPDNGSSSWFGADWKTDMEQTTAIFRRANLAADWLIVDHYGLDCRWETQMRPFYRKIMVIDDLADRPHHCDVLLDQNLYENFETRYDGLVPEQCRKLLGPKYVLLRPEFMEARSNMRGRDGCVSRILIFFGGSDPSNETEKVLETLSLLDRSDIAKDVIIGASNPHKKQIVQICSTLPNTKLHCQAENMAELIAKADLAIGAGGSTTWERCCLGLPSIIISIAKNQDAIAEQADRSGIGKYIGPFNAISPHQLKVEITKMLDCRIKMVAMSRKCFDLVDGEGSHLTSNVLLQN